MTVHNVFQYCYDHVTLGFAFPVNRYAALEAMTGVHDD
jgi:hypothetical protein